MNNLINPWNLLCVWEPWGNFIPEYRPGNYLKSEVSSQGWGSGVSVMNGGERWRWPGVSGSKVEKDLFSRSCYSLNSAADAGEILARGGTKYRCYVQNVRPLSGMLICMYVIILIIDLTWEKLCQLALRIVQGVSLSYCTRFIIILELFYHHSDMGRMSWFLNTRNLDGLKSDRWRHFNGQEVAVEL